MATKPKIGPSSYLVLKRLAAGGWVLDRYGTDGLSGWMGGPGHRQVILRPKTMNALLSEGLIEPACNGISDYRISEMGRAAVNSDSAEDLLRREEAENRRIVAQEGSL